MERSTAIRHEQKVPPSHEICPKWFERDPRWLADGRRRLVALEQKLNQLKTRPSQPQAN